MSIDISTVGVFRFNSQYNKVANIPTYLTSPDALKEDSIFNTQEPDSDFRIIAHRGDSDDAPENTIEAMESAVNNGYLTAECDISWTKDNVPVLLHDNTINRTGRKANGSKFMVPRQVSSYTFGQLQNFDFGRWFGSDFKGVKIPSLQEALDFAKENDLELYLDLKDNVNLDDEKISALIQMVQDSDMEDNVTWISFNAKNLEKISKIQPSARLGYLSEGKITTKTIDTLKSLKNSENDVFLDIKYTKITDSGLAMLEQADFYWEAWTVDNLSTAKTLAESGCKGITTNRIQQDDLGEITGTED